MPIKLNEQQESLLKGDKGKGVALAMKTLVQYGEAFGSTRITPITSGHLAGSFGMLHLEAYPEILDRLVADKAKFVVKTTINPKPGRDMNFLNKIIFSKQQKIEDSLKKLGLTENYSCVCYDEVNVPKKGDALGWAESSAVQYANSVLGARVNRNSLIIDICSSVTGYTPEFGYLLDENRFGKMLVKLDIREMDAPALGFILGQKVVDQVPVVEHYPFDITQLKNMGGSMAASGAVALFHVEGVTPEAPDMKTAFGGKEPEKTITVTQADLDALRFGKPGDADMVVFGCPQMTYDEVMQLSEKFAGIKKVKKPVMFCMIPAVKEKYIKTAEYKAVKSAGVEVSQYCPLAALSVRIGKKCILTNSGKLYYYLKGTQYGNMQDCLSACGV